jgi:hypothetical protein
LSYVSVCLTSAVRPPTLKFRLVRSGLYDLDSAIPTFGDFDLRL